VEAVEGKRQKDKDKYFLFSQRIFVDDAFRQISLFKPLRIIYLLI
jgi:hypothetical protein